MKQQLYREVNDGVGTKLIEVSEEEVKAAKELSLVNKNRIYVAT